MELVAAHIQKQIVFYPRLHSSLELLVSEIGLEKKEKDRIKLVSLVNASFLSNCVFNEEIYTEMKSNKYKFLQIGFLLWERLIDQIKGWKEVEKKLEESAP